MSFPYDNQSRKYADEPLVYRTQTGAKGVLPSGIIRNSDGTPHEAYGADPSTSLGALLSGYDQGTLDGPSMASLANELRKRGYGGTLEEMVYKYRARMTHGLPSVPTQGGSGNSLKNNGKYYTGGVYVPNWTGR